MTSVSNPAIQQSVADLDRNLKISLTEVLAKCYGEGFVKAAEALDATPHVTRDDSDLLKKDVERLVKPIQDYNQALGDKIYDIVQEGFASGKDDLQVAADLRSRIPEILNNEPITIQRPGKRPVSYTAEGYAEMVAGIIPYQVRGNGYVRGLEESGADGWEWVATDDERMCEVCGDLNGQAFDFDKQFDIAHPGCRCRPVAWFKPKTKEEEAESERIKEKAKEEPWNVEEDETPAPKTTDKDEVADQLVEPIYPKKYAYPGSTIERPVLKHQQISLEESDTVKSFADSMDKSIISYTDNAHEDPFMKKLVKEVEFDKPPKIVSAKDLDNIVAEGHIELYRGVSEEKFAKEFMSGEYFAGTGFHGNGTYTAYGPNGANYAANYADKSRGALVRMAIDKDAKIISDKDLKELSENLYNQIDKSQNEQLETIRSEIVNAKSKEAADELKQKLSDYETRFYIEKQFVTEPGKVAIMNGYDAIDIQELKFLVVLNRGSLYVQSDIITGEKIALIKKMSQLEDTIRTINDLRNKSLAGAKDLKMIEFTNKSYDMMLETYVSQLNELRSQMG